MSCLPIHYKPFIALLFAALGEFAWPRHWVKPNLCPCRNSSRWPRYPSLQCSLACSPLVPALLQKIFTRLGQMCSALPQQQFGTLSAAYAELSVRAEDLVTGELELGGDATFDVANPSVLAAAAATADSQQQSDDTIAVSLTSLKASLLTTVQLAAAAAVSLSVVRLLAALADQRMFDAQQPQKCVPPDLAEQLQGLPSRIRNWLCCAHGADLLPAIQAALHEILTAAPPSFQEPDLNTEDGDSLSQMEVLPRSMLLLFSRVLAEADFVVIVSDCGDGAGCRVARGASEAACCGRLQLRASADGRRKDHGVAIRQVLCRLAQ